MLEKSNHFSFTNKKENKNLIYHKLNEDKNSLDEKENKILNSEKKGKIKIDFIQKYKKYEVDIKKNNNSRFKGYKNIENEMKVKQKERQILQDIINLKTTLELFDENKSLVNKNVLKPNKVSLLLEEKNKTTNKIKNPLKAIIPFNHNCTTMNDFHNEKQKIKFMESTKSKIILNIIRKRFHINKSQDMLKNNKTVFTQQNSLINEQNKKNYNSVTNIKYPLNNKFNIQENYLRLFGKKIKSENKIKFKKTFLLIKKDKIKDNEKILRFKPQRKQKNYQINQVNSIGGQSGSLIKPIN